MTSRPRRTPGRFADQNYRLLNTPAALTLTLAGGAATLRQDETTLATLSAARLAPHLPAVTAALNAAGATNGTVSRTGVTELCRSLGRQLALLMIALEQAAPEEDALILEAWTRLHPVERVWLASRALSGETHDQGWRVAVYLALSAHHTAIA